MWKESGPGEGRAGGRCRWWGGGSAEAAMVRAVEERVKVGDRGHEAAGRLHGPAVVGEVGASGAAGGGDGGGAEVAEPEPETDGSIKLLVGPTPPVVVPWPGPRPPRRRAGDGAGPPRHDRGLGQLGHRTAAPGGGSASPWSGLDLQSASDQDPAAEEFLLTWPNEVR